MPDGVLILGAGGHGKVIADAILRRGQALAGFLDDRHEIAGSVVLGSTVHGKTDTWLQYHPSGLIIAIGDNELRRRMAEKIELSGHEPPWVTVLHPSAIISDSATVGLGTVIMAGAIVNPDTHLGQHVIINTAATVDHDCVIGDYSHIAPGAHLAGGVVTGDQVMIGIGASVLPGCHVGANAVIGAGTVVLHDVPAGITVVGVPARVIQR